MNGVREHVVPHLLVGGFVALVLNSAYLASFSEPSLFYLAQVALHPVLGLVLAGALIPRIVRRARMTRLAATAAAVTAAGVLLGVGVLVLGATRPYRGLLHAHVVTMIAASALLVVYSWAATARWSGWQRSFGRLALLLAVAAGAGAPLARIARDAAWQRAYRIENPTVVAGCHGRGGRRPGEPVLPLVRQHQRRRHHPGEFLHDERDRAAAATRTSTTSGTRRRTTSRRSTISGTASPSSTCRMSSAPSRRSGAPGATTTRCSSTAGSTGRSRSRSTPRKRRPAWAARRAIPSSTSTARWGRATSTIEYPPLHDLAASDHPVLQRAHDAAPHARSAAAPRHVSQAVPPGADAGVLLDVPQGPSRRAR